MEGLDVEAGTKLLLAMAEFENLELADLIAEPLSGPCNTSVNFCLDRRLIGGAAGAEVSHCLFAAPAFGVNARIDDKANRTHQLQRETPIIGRQILKKPDLLTESLGIDRPAFGTGIVDKVQAKLRQAGELLLD